MPCFLALWLSGSLARWLVVSLVLWLSGEVKFNVLADEHGRFSQVAWFMSPTLRATREAAGGSVFNVRRAVHGVSKWEICCEGQ